MKVQQHRLKTENGSFVPLISTVNQGDLFAAGRLRYLIIHYTAGGNAAGAISWFKNPAADASAHLVIDHDGAVTQMVKFDRVAWHAGRSSWKEGNVTISGLNQYSIGIEIANWGLLNRTDGDYVSWTGRRVDSSKVVLAKHKNYRPNETLAWEIFDEAQFESTLNCARAILDQYQIPVENVLGHDDISPVRKQDPGPAFSLDKLRGLLRGREEDKDDLMMVNSSTGLNLRAGPGTSFTVKKNLQNGTVVRLLGSDDGWVKVMALKADGSDDDDGFVSARYLVDA